MKKIKEQFKSKSPAELKADLVAHEEKLQKMRFDLSFNKLKNTNEIGETRKNVARIRTYLNISSKLRS